MKTIRVNKVLIKIDGDNPIEKYVTIGLVVFLIAFLCVGVVDVYTWHQFKKANNCVEFSTINGGVDMGVGVGTNGQVVNVITTIPNRVAYDCNGEVYFR